jgi:hypothetical protein
MVHGHPGKEAEADERDSGADLHAVRSHVTEVANMLDRKIEQLVAQAIR